MNLYKVTPLNEASNASDSALCRDEDGAPPVDLSPSPCLVTIYPEQINRTSEPKVSPET